MRFTTFIECYQDWKLTGYNDRYQVGQEYIGFTIDNSGLIIDICDCTYLYELKELIKYIIRDTTRKIILPSNGENITKFDLNDDFYGYTFYNINGNAVLDKNY